MLVWLFWQTYLAHSARLAERGFRTERGRPRCLRLVTVNGVRIAP